VLLVGLLAAGPAAAETLLDARVVGVSDGDTITVLYGNRPLKVRLEGIDCPESGQAFGAAAKLYTSDLVFGKTVTVEPRTTDRYGRTVADVTDW
jgi:micrococcal nuclease